jgi:hypothetical protein
MILTQLQPNSQHKPTLWPSSCEFPVRTRISSSETYVTRKLYPDDYRYRETEKENEKKKRETANCACAQRLSRPVMIHQSFALRV